MSPLKKNTAALKKNVEELYVCITTDRACQIFLIELQIVRRTSGRIKEVPNHEVTIWSRRPFWPVGFRPSRDVAISIPTHAFCSRLIGCDYVMKAEFRTMHNLRPVCAGIAKIINMTAYYPFKCFYLHCNCTVVGVKTLTSPRSLAPAAYMGKKGRW